MVLSMKRRSQQIAANQQEYQESYQALNFPPIKELEAAQRQRDALLAALAGQVETGCHGAKLDMRNLSPGCRICVAGGWSCLFISGKCNCDCFYCPTIQDDIGLPTTNTVAFRHPADYVTYLERFGFSGASISGGEPLLTPNRTLGFITAIKRHFGAKLHLWLYTNGTLLTEELLLQLRDAGLDEIRFDIGAADYQLKALKRAAGIIPTLTVEIPAIPEEVERLKGLLFDLQDVGVQHLNLHQLRLTPHNYPRLLSRGYRFLHGDKVSVLDSELAALEILQYAVEKNVGPAINYCSFVYKNRFQSQAARLRNATFVSKGFESLTENGYIRILTLLGDKPLLDRQVGRFVAQGCDAGLWSLSRSGEQLSFHPTLWNLIDQEGMRLQLSYASARQMTTVTYRNPFVSVELSARQKLIVERGKALADIELDQEQTELYVETFLLSRRSAENLPDEGPWDEIVGMEQNRGGLQEYF
jgi:uncharacterized protein